MTGNGFGIRLQWICDLIIRTDFWAGNHLGNRQYEAFRTWMIESDFIARDNAFTEVGALFSKTGINNKLFWQILWINLFLGSNLVYWYCQTAINSVSYGKSELIELLKGDLSLRSRENAISSLLEIFRFTPLGEMGFGKIEYMAGSKNRVATVTKELVEFVDPALLYAFYKYADFAGNRTIVIESLFDKSDNEINLPVLLGLSKHELVKAVSKIAVLFPALIKFDSSKTGTDVIQLREFSVAEILHKYIRGEMA